MKAYKFITNNSGNGWASATIYNTFKVVYKVGEKAEPTIPGSSLFVFKHFEDARVFAKNHSLYNGAIFECEVPRLFKLKRMAGWFFESSMKKFWATKRAHKKPVNFSVPPKGTYGTPWLILTNKIESL